MSVNSILHLGTEIDAKTSLSRHIVFMGFSELIVTWRVNTEAFYGCKMFEHEKGGRIMRGQKKACYDARKNRVKCKSYHNGHGGCRDCAWYRYADGKDLCLCDTDCFNEVTYLPKSSRQMLGASMRGMLEKELYEYVKQSPQRMEAFTDTEYLGKTVKTVYEKMQRRIKKMSNVELVRLIQNIRHADAFDGYESMFR